MKEIYVSTDIEADGPIPGPHSMLSFASAAFDEDGALIATFERNLETLPGASADPKTMQWWATQQVAWEICRKDPSPPEIAMAEYVMWVEGLAAVPVFVAYPTGFDFTFIFWYLIRFVGKSPFAYRALDMRSYAMAALRTSFAKAGKEHMPMAWMSNLPHTHRALDDALEQGEMFCKMMKATRGGAVSSDR